MQLLGIFLLLYVLEGWLRLPPGAALFVRSRGGWRLRRRLGREGGDALLPLRPGGLPVWAAPLPLEIDGDGIRSTAPVAGFGFLRAPRATAPRLRFEELGDAHAAGLSVRARGITLLRAIARPEARAIAALLAKLATANGAQRDELLAAERAREPAPDAMRSQIETARSALRAATRICDAYALLLFAAIPLGIALQGETTALLASLPALVVLHGAALWFVRRAHRELLPGDAADRREALFAAALFPPTLLRLPQRTFLAAVGTPAPALAAAALLDGDARTDFLRRALAEAEHDAHAAPDACERVLAIAAQVGVDAAELRRGPERTDPLATAYCPRCFEGYRAGIDRCADCAIELRPYAA